MSPHTFKAMIADIETYLDDGDAYSLNFRTRSGDRWLNYAWQRGDVKKGTDEFAFIILTKPDCPPVYLPIASIESLELCS